MGKMVNFRLRNASSREVTGRMKVQRTLPAPPSESVVVVDLISDDEDEDARPALDTHSEVNDPSPSQPERTEIPGPDAEPVRNKPSPPPSEIPSPVDLQASEDGRLRAHDAASKAPSQHTSNDGQVENAASITRNPHIIRETAIHPTGPLPQYSSPHATVELPNQERPLPSNLTEDQQVDWIDQFLADLRLGVTFCTPGSEFAGQLQISLKTCYTSHELLSRIDGQIPMQAKAAGWSARALVVQFSSSDQICVSRTDCEQYRRVMRKIARLGKHVSVATRVWCEGG